jgi:hypothetical protein
MKEQPLPTGKKYFILAGKKNVPVLICGASAKVKRSLMAQKGGDSLTFHASLEEAELTLKV